MARRTQFGVDYNRGLPLPIRWARRGVGWVVELLAPIWEWSGRSIRREWARPLVISIVLMILTFPLDGVLSALGRGLPIGGDLRRELLVLQQYGAIASLLIVAAIIWLQDPQRRRNLADLGAAVIVGAISVTVIKAIVGRPRPRDHMREIYDHTDVLGPFGAAPLQDSGVRHAWELWAPRVSDIQSFPSSHTLYAVILSVFLLSLYPRLRPLLIAFPIIVGCARVIFGSHYPTDVIAGACLGLIIGRIVVRTTLGQRVLNRK
jgi:membrane-associated phospholipid phosphatase